MAVLLVGVSMQVGDKDELVVAAGGVALVRALLFALLFALLLGDREAPSSRPSSRSA